MALAVVRVAAQVVVRMAALVAAPVVVRAAAMVAAPVVVRAVAQVAVQVAAPAAVQAVAPVAALEQVPRLWSQVRLLGKWVQWSVVSAPRSAVLATH